MMAQQEQIAIIGGGIAGLASAHALVRHGVAVTIFESSDQLGGLGTFFEWSGHTFEKFYHCMLPSDGPLLGLLDALGLSGDIYWQESKFGYLNNGTIYPLNGALDLLRFSPLSFSDRLRVGLTGLYGSLCSSRGLDEISATEWLSKLSGPRAFKTFWQPMLEAKFGDRFEDVPALWFWQRFNREKGGKKEVKGYIRGGYKRIIDSLEHDITQHGGVIRRNSPIEEISPQSDRRVMLAIDDEEYTYDRVIITAAPPALSRISLQDDLEESLRPHLNLPYQGVVNSVLFLDCPLDGYYWTATPEPQIPFQGIVETSSLINSEDSAGYTLVHLMNYCSCDSPTFNKTEEEIISEREAALLAIRPALKQENIKSHHVFRAPHVEPIYTRSYQQKKPPLELIPGTAYLLTSSQVYPDVTSWNGSCGLAKTLVKKILES